MEVGSTAGHAAFIEWRFDYVSLMEKLRDEREEGRMEGRMEGRREGEARGRIEGRKEERLKIMNQLLSAGIITPEQAKQFANA